MDNKITGSNFMKSIRSEQNQTFQAMSSEEFVKKPLDERLEILPFITPARRQSIIIDCKDSSELVTHMEAQDLFLTIKEIGLRDSVALLEIMNAEQFRYCIDLDCWIQDTIKHPQFWEWLNVLALANIKKAASNLSQLDLELVSATFSESVKVLTAKEDFDPDEGTPPGYSTIDGVHYLGFNCPQETSDTIYKILSEYFQFDHDFYMRLLNTIKDSLQTMKEEDAYQWKSARLADLGFPEYPEALRIYSRPDKNAAKPSITLPVSSAENPPPTFAIIRTEGEGMLSMSLMKKLSGRQCSELAASAAVLANWIIVADKVDPGDSEALRKVIEKAKGILSIGLAAFGGEPSEALNGKSLMEIFRMGYSKILDLSERAKSLVAVHPLVSDSKNFSRLDSVTSGTLKALMLKRPMFFTGAADPLRTDTDNFLSIDDISAVARVLDEIDASAELFGFVFRIFKKDILALDPEKLNVESHDAISAMMIANTAIANMSLSGKYSAAPISTSLLPNLKSILFATDGKDGLVLKDQALKIIGEISDKVAERRKPIRSAAHEYLKKCLEELKDSLARIDMNKIDSPLIDTILLKAE